MKTKTPPAVSCPPNLLTLMPVLTAPNIVVAKPPPITQYHISVKYMDFQYTGDIRLLKQTLNRLKKNLNPLLKDTVENINGVVSEALPEEFDNEGYD